MVNGAPPPGTLLSSESFNGKPQASVPRFAYACGSPFNENANIEP
ncbi:MAG: hypothetical protein WCO86_05275 [Planctomycetota bacterium]